MTMDSFSALLVFEGPFAQEEIEYAFGEGFWLYAEHDGSHIYRWGIASKLAGDPDGLYPLPSSIKNWREGREWMQVDLRTRETSGHFSKENAERIGRVFATVQKMGTRP